MMSDMSNHLNINRSWVKVKKYAAHSNGTPVNIICLVMNKNKIDRFVSIQDADFVEASRKITLEG